MTLIGETAGAPPAGEVIKDATDASFAADVLDASREELMRRLTDRNVAPPTGTFRIDEALLDHALERFERPSEAELALFDDARMFGLDDVDEDRRSF